MALVLIAAVARNGVIGAGNALVFKEAVDQRHFKEATLGHPVVMGRKTWQSLPARFRPLPGRHNIVVSSDAQLDAPGATVAGSLQQALDAAGNAERIFVIGGAQLYAQALPRADELMLTEIDADLAGDIFFPPWPREAFSEVSRQAHHGADGTAFAFVTYRRRP